MIRAHDYQPAPRPLREGLELSVYVEACKNVIAQARAERLPGRRESQLREADRQLREPEFHLLTPVEQEELFQLYSEAYLINLRAG